MSSTYPPMFNTNLAVQNYSDAHLVTGHIKFFRKVTKRKNSTIMNTPHLTAGSAQPALIPGKLRVYATRFSSHAQRVLLELEYKKIPYDIVFVNLKNKPEWFVKKNPYGTVPVIEFENDQYIFGSQIIGDYLDEAYPEKKMYPADPFTKAQDKIFIQRYFTIEETITELYSKDNTVSFEKVLAFFDEFNYEFKKRGKAYFGGDRPGLIDFYFWPIYERFDVLKIFRGDKYTFSRERFSYLFQWGNNMKKENSVKTFFLEPEVHAKFIKSELAGKPDFDFLYN